MRIYGDVGSGNCYKIKLLLSLLNIKHVWIHVDILKKDTQTQEFLSLNPNGKIPVLVLEDGRVLSESNAILGYLAEGTKFIPIDPYIKAKCTSGCSLNNIAMNLLLQLHVLLINI